MPAEYCTLVSCLNLPGLFSLLGGAAARPSFQQSLSTAGDQLSIHDTLRCALRQEQLLTIIQHTLIHLPPCRTGSGAAPAASSSSASTTPSSAARSIPRGASGGPISSAVFSGFLERDPQGNLAPVQGSQIPQQRQSQ